MSADITLTFQAIGAEKIVSEVKKIQDSIHEAVKGLDLSGLDALKESIDKATAAAEEMNATLADAEVDDLGEDVDDASESFEEFGKNAEDAAGSLESLEKRSKRTQGELSGLDRAARFAKKALAGLAIAATVKKSFGFLADGIHNAFKAGSEFSKMAASLGTDAGSARVLAQAFEEAGMSAQSVVPMVSKMQRKIAEGSAAFKALGLDAEALKGKSALEQMEALGEAVRKVGDQEGKMKVLMAIFEEAGPQLSKFFNNPDALGNASRTLGSSVKIMRENAEAFDRAAVLISNISTKIGTFFEGVVAGVVNPLNSLLGSLNAIDLAAEGKKFGDEIADSVKIFYKAFLNDQFFELFSLKLSRAVAGATESLWSKTQRSGKKAAAAVAAFNEANLDEVGIFLEGKGISGADALNNARKSYGKRYDEYYAENLKSGQKAIDAFNSFFVEDVAGGKPGDTLSKKLKELEEQLVRSLNRSSPGNPVAPKDEQKPSEVKIPEFNLDLSGLLGGSPSFTPKTDALQRVGGTIGGMSGAQLAPARKTAENTSKLVGLANDIRSTLKTRQPSESVAVYA